MTAPDTPDCELKPPDLGEELHQFPCEITNCLLQEVLLRPHDPCSKLGHGAVLLQFKRERERKAITRKLGNSTAPWDPNWFSLSPLTLQVARPGSRRHKSSVKDNMKHIFKVGWASGELVLVGLRGSWSLLYEDTESKSFLESCPHLPWSTQPTASGELTFTQWCDGRTWTGLLRGEAMSGKFFLSLSLFCCSLSVHALLLSFDSLVCKVRTVIPDSRKQVHSNIYEPGRHLVNGNGSSSFSCSHCKFGSGLQCLHRTLCFLHPERDLDLIASVCLGFALYESM